MGSFVVMFRMEEAKVEVDSKKNLWCCKALVEQDWWDRLVGREMACAACRLVQDSPGGGRWQKRRVLEVFVQKEATPPTCIKCCTKVCSCLSFCLRAWSIASLGL